MARGVDVEVINWEAQSIDWWAGHLRQFHPFYRQLFKCVAYLPEDARWDMLEKVAEMGDPKGLTPEQSEANEFFLQACMNFVSMSQPAMDRITQAFAKIGDPIKKD